MIRLTKTVQIFLVLKQIKTKRSGTTLTVQNAQNAVKLTKNVDTSKY